MTDTDIDRRTVLRVAGAGAAGAAGLAALAACGSSSSASSSTTSATASSTGSSAASSGGSSAASSAATSPATSSATSAATSSASGGAKIVALADVPVGGSVAATINGKPALVTRPQAGTVKAFSSVCTHQGCTVNPGPGPTLDCPCHGSKFNASTGAPVNGPASSPLASIPVTVSGGNVVAG